MTLVALILAALALLFWLATFVGRLLKAAGEDEQVVRRYREHEADDVSYGGTDD